MPDYHLMGQSNLGLEKESAPLVVGHIGKSHGVRGWVRIISFTEPAERLFAYTPWYLKAVAGVGGWLPYQLTQHQTAGKYFIAKLHGCDTVECAKTLNHAVIGIKRSQLDLLSEGEYYWADLEGLAVMTVAGKAVGCVDHLLATGSNDVLVVKDVEGNTCLIPYIDSAIKTVNLKDAYILVEDDYIVCNAQAKKT